MSAESSNGTLTRTFRQLFNRDPDLGSCALLLATALESDEDYPTAGSNERDTKAALTGEFGASFADPAELPMEDFVEKSSDYDIAAEVEDFDTMAQQLLAEESTTGEEGALYA